MSNEHIITRHNAYLEYAREKLQYLLQKRGPRTDKEEKNLNAKPDYLYRAIPKPGEPINYVPISLENPQATISVFIVFLP